MIAIADVKIWNYKVGVVLWDEQRNCGFFEFDKNFFKLGLDISPFLMPIAEAQKTNAVFSFPALNPETFKGLPGLLADSLPDKFARPLHQPGSAPTRESRG